MLIKEAIIFHTIIDIISEAEYLHVDCPSKFLFQVFVS